MVKKLQSLDFDDEGKARVILNGSAAENVDLVIESYRTYDCCCGDATRFKRIDISEGNANLFKKAYESESQTNVAYKESIRGIAGSWCPMCGAPSSPYTLEHYLPKSIFPEYSVYSKNLIPACAECNTKKGVRYSENGVMLFLHCYYDNACNSSCISLCIDGDLSKPSVSIVPDACLGVRDARIVQTHISILNISERFKLYFRDHYYEHWERIRKRALRYGFKSIKQDLEEDIEAKCIRLGHNHWDVVLLRGILAGKVLDFFCNNDCPN